MIMEQPIEMPVETDRKSEKGNKIDEKINDNLTFPLIIDSEDFCRTISQCYNKQNASTKY